MYKKGCNLEKEIIISAVNAAGIFVCKQIQIENRYMKEENV